MQYSSRYKQFFSAVFLLLYFFIATPVQLWHQHSVVQKEKSASLKITAAKAGVQNDECKICQHTYTSYINDNASYFVTELSLLSCNTSFQDIVFPFPFIDNASNKGPPQI